MGKYTSSRRSFAPTSTQAKPSDAFTPTSDFGSSNGFSPRSSPAGHPSAQPVQHVDPFGVKQATASVSAMSLMQQSVNEVSAMGIFCAVSLCV